jgi:hypothetical protein
MQGDERPAGQSVAVREIIMTTAPGTRNVLFGDQKTVGAIEAESLERFAASCRKAIIRTTVAAPDLSRLSGRRTRSATC